MSPRAFSSGNRSGSVPVRASTSVDLPWSTWPAVATVRTAPIGSAGCSGEGAGDALVVDRVDRAQVAHNSVVLDPGDDVVLTQARQCPRLPPRTSTPTPTDGIVEPGNEPPPATASVSTTLAAGTAAAIDSARVRRPSDGAVAMRQSGIAVASPER